MIVATLARTSSLLEVCSRRSDGDQEVDTVLIELEPADALTAAGRPRPGRVDP